MAGLALICEFTIDVNATLFYECPYLLPLYCDQYFASVCPGAAVIGRGFLLPIHIYLRQRHKYTTTYNDARLTDRKNTIVY